MKAASWRRRICRRRGGCAGGCVAGGRDAPAGAGASAGGPQARIPVLNEIGLHARPAALVVELASRFDADLRLAKPGGAGSVSARSITGLMTLVARKGDELLATASGPQAREALAALEELARNGFGEGVAGDAAPAPRADRRAAQPPARLAPAEPHPRDRTSRRAGGRHAAARDPRLDRDRARPGPAASRAARPPRRASRPRAPRPSAAGWSRRATMPAGDRARSRFGGRPGRRE